MLGLARNSGVVLAKAGSVVKSAPYQEKNMRGSIADITVSALKAAPSGAPGRFKCRRRNLCVGNRLRCCSRYPGLPQLAMLGLARSSGVVLAKAGSVVK